MADQFECLTDAEIADLRRLLGSATPAPWMSGRTDMLFFDEQGQLKNVYGPHTHPHHVTGKPVRIEVAQARGENCMADAALIAEAISALPRLLDEVEQRRARDA
jgi:hypothetical protein